MYEQAFRMRFDAFPDGEDRPRVEVLEAEVRWVNDEGEVRVELRRGQVKNGKERVALTISTESSAEPEQYDEHADQVVRAAYGRLRRSVRGVTMR